VRYIALQSATNESLKAMPNAPFSLRLKPHVKARLEEEARIADRSASYLANKAVEAFLEARAFKREQIAAALAEADKGVFVSEEAMGKWMESWDTENELPPPEPDIFY
jgi:predicted transcriptional regulator